METELRLVNEGELDEYAKAVTRGFGHHFDRKIFETYRPADLSARALAAFDGDEIIGTILSYPLEMYVPGGMLPTTLLDSVTVQPTHRRQGILTKMTAWTMKDFHERGEVLSCLGASESVIYGRFGYGPASLQVDFTVDRPYTSFSHFPDVSGKLRFVERPEARRLFPGITHRACSERPGYLKGSEELWDLYLADPEPSREGASALFMVAYEEAGQPEGYVTYRIREGKVSWIRSSARLWSLVRCSAKRRSSGASLSNTLARARLSPLRQNFRKSFSCLPISRC